MSALVHAWRRFWFAPIEAGRVEALRRGLGLVLLAYVISWGIHIDEWLTVGGFHPSPRADPLRAPRLPLLPRSIAPAVGIAYLVVMGAWLLGLARRLTSWLVWAGVVYVTAADPISAFTINRLFMITLLILALSEQRTRGLISAWPLRMVQVLLLTHYFASGLCKCFHGDWLDQTDVLWTQVQGIYMTDAAAWSIRAVSPQLWTWIQHTALGFELAAPLLFSLRHTRTFALLFGLAFHVIIAVSMFKLIYFSAQMVALYIVFVPVTTLRRWGLAPADATKGSSAS